MGMITGNVNMGLDKDTQRILGQMASGLDADAPLPTIDESRVNLHDLFVEYAPQRKAVKSYKRCLLDGRCGSFPIDIFWPYLEPKQLAPLVLFIHGGGWVQGGLQSYQNLVRHFCAEAGVAVISVGYHLAPEHKFPSALHDCHNALQWAVDNAEDLGIDADRIILMGDSAGGNLVAALNIFNQQQSRIPITGQFLLYPLLNVSAASHYPSRDEFGQGEYLISNEHIRWAREHYLENPELADSPLVSPFLSNELSLQPRSFIMTAGCDPLRDEGRAYHDKLLAAGVDSEYVCVAGTIHGFLSLAASISAGRDGLSLVVCKLREFLSGNTGTEYPQGQNTDSHLSELAYD